jgi:hypothetical protein
MSTHFMGVYGFKWPTGFKDREKDGIKPYLSTQWIRIARVLAMVVFLLFILIML